ncbi:hypothetical protein FRB94_007659 [Tulasnella sp. JGI-2019a]|nr:hypothetical protein FRB94_007659 [Tulasnella sp. JGI-2019a]
MDGFRLAETDPDARAVSAFDLGVDLWSRFQQIGHRSDLDESITYHREALNLRPEGHPCRSVSLSYLAVGLHTRFQQTEDKGDIDECIKYIFSLMTCPEPTGDRSDLYKGINDLREALDLFPKEHSGSAPSFADTDPGSRLALITGQG